MRNDLLKQLEELKKKAERVFSGRGKSLPRVTGKPQPLHELIHGTEEDSERGKFFRCTVSAEDVWKEAPSFYDDYLKTIAEPQAALDGPLEALTVLQSAKTTGVCYLDIETTGLGSSPLFLIGLMYENDGGLYLDQLFARDYSEEESVLHFFNDLMSRFDIVVTFNGARFDIPFIAERMAYHRIPFELRHHHLDLLPISRELVGTGTPDHRLQTLERHLCGRKRVGDIPGHEIPEAYHEFVRTGDAAAIQTIFHHNRLDLVTMLQLITIYLSRGRPLDE